MKKARKAVRASSLIAVAVVMMAGSFTVVSTSSAQSFKAKSTKIPPKLQRIVKKQTSNKKFMSRARRAGDEMDECMSNPDNAHIEYTERLASCFCLSIDNSLKGCQSAN